MSLIYSLLAGVIFGAGLTVSDMVNPARVLNFLDVAGHPQRYQERPWIEALERFDAEVAELLGELF